MRSKKGIKRRGELWHDVLYRGIGLYKRHVPGSAGKTDRISSRDDVEVGADAVEVLGLRDAVFEYEVTSNRVDCFSVIGIAREAAATFGKSFYPPIVPETGNDEDASDYIKVEVRNQELCSRYCARVAKNIKIGPSPEWMQRRLASVGIRPINNLVDITNYVMEEYGQPMHAYDLDTIAGHQIIVRMQKTVRHLPHWMDRKAA